MLLSVVTVVTNAQIRLSCYQKQTKCIIQSTLELYGRKLHDHVPLRYKERQQS